jgi:hypothetical protein
MQETTAWAEEGVAPLFAPEDAGLAWDQFEKLVIAAVGHFNRGSLLQAANLLDFAEALHAEQAFDRTRVDRVRDRLGQALDGGRLRAAAEHPPDRPLLRIVLHFFSAFACGALLDALRSEPRRERRRWFLLMLEAHGAPARAAAAARLMTPLDPAPDVEEWYCRRNLLHLLRRIPRADGLPADQDVDIAVRHARLGIPSFVLKEAIGLLGQIRNERAELALSRLLQEVEDMMRARDSYSETRNLPAIADRAATALSGFPGQRARRAVIDYAERAFVNSGRPMTSLSALGHYDLSSDEITVDRLVGLIRRGRHSSLSSKLLFQGGDERDGEIIPVIEALAATPLPVVRRALEDVARRHPAKGSGRAAARVLANLPRPDPSAVKHDGTRSSDSGRLRPVIVRFNSANA